MGVAVLEGVRVVEGVRVSVGMRVRVAVSVPVAVRVSRRVLVGVCVTVPVRLGVGGVPPGVSVTVGVTVGVDGGVADGDAVAVGALVAEVVRVAVAIGVAVTVGLVPVGGVRVGPRGVIVDVAVGVDPGSSAMRATTSAELSLPSPFTSRPGHELSAPNKPATKASKSAWSTRPSQLVSPSNAPPIATVAATKSAALESEATTRRRPAGNLAGRRGLRSLGIAPFRHCTA